ncbi:unnamed protein product [Cylindrotheca closterium]|uniref:Uncharacterized protein n=1 Tax=Cylindrotheca closterium TaxID=2856 RepID=A0AAD2FI06_9STRA|nr:unnamed protein product [Cylindrotheca closterium]
MTIHRISKYGKLLILVQRTHTPALGTIPNLLFTGQFYDENPDLMEGDSYPLPPHPPKFNNRDGQIMMENIEIAGDPGFLRADDGSRSIKEELVRRAAHTGAVFRCNNQKFWVMLHAVTHETDAYNHVRQFAPTLNGQAAYFALFAQYCGRGHFTNECQAAVCVIATLHWNGDAVLRSNFQGAIDYLTTQVLAAGNDNTQRRNRQLAAFTRGGGGRGGDGRNGGRGRGNGATNRLQSNVPDRLAAMVYY